MMHEQFANSFYGSEAWKQCRRAYAKARGGLCERCLSRGLYTPGVEVHHKRPITPDNMGDPDVTLNWDNLMLLCKACHMEVHRELSRPDRRWQVDETGTITTV